MAEDTNLDIEKQNTSQEWAKSLGTWLAPLLAAIAGASFNWIVAAVLGVIVLIAVIVVPILIKNKNYQNAKEESAGQVGTAVGNQETAIEAGRDNVDEFLNRPKR